MATISSHVLDSVIGDHAKQIRIELFRIAADGGRTQLFNVIADSQGRIAETVKAEAIGADAAARFELVFHSAAYFSTQPAAPKSAQIMPEIIVRFLISNPTDKIHIPIMLSPHSYSTWWSA